MIDPRDFGAVGDRIADDTAALQAALDTLAVVHIPPGEYRISKPLYVRGGKT